MFLLVKKKKLTYSDYRKQLLGEANNFEKKSHFILYFKNVHFVHMCTCVHVCVGVN